MGKREDIKTGDLLIWTKDSRSTISNTFLEIVRTLTRSEYAHVGTAFWFNERLFVIEATMPMIRIAPIRNDEEFFYVPTGVTWTEEAEDFIMSKIGLLYSIVDGVRAYLGKTVKKDDKYQCAELTRELYNDHLNLRLPEVYTPSKLVDAVMMVCDAPIYKVEALK